MIFTNYRFMDYEKKHRHTVTRHTFSQSSFIFPVGNFHLLSFKNYHLFLQQNQMRMC